MLQRLELNNRSAKKYPWKRKLALIKDYFFNSDERLYAWLMLTGIALCTITLVTLTLFFPVVLEFFWTALTTKAFTPLLTSVGYFVSLISAYAGIDFLKTSLVGRLAIRWRSWLTTKIFKELLQSDNYLELKRNSKIDNISQRVEHNIKTMVGSTLSLGFGLLQTLLVMIVFSISLAAIGGTLTFALLGVNIIIPGYLVWVALTISLAAAITTHFIGKSLLTKNQLKESVEANLRQELDVLSDDAENIAQENAREYHQQSLGNQVQEINQVALQTLETESKIGLFQNFYTFSTIVLPFLAAAPLYFMGRFDLAQLMQIGNSFGQVSNSSTWFVTAYADFAKYTTSLDRVIELQEEIESGPKNSNPKSIAFKTRLKDTIKIKHLDISPPQRCNSDFLFRNLNLKLVPKEHTLIQGPSGFGKSTLFKAIAGTWKYGSGKISLPKDKKIYFLPQKPTLPYASLERVLAYPEPVSTYSHEKYIFVLKQLKMEQFIPQLKEKRHWSKELSGGQQQRIAFARVLLKEPHWVFMDEATASLDEESEDELYSLVSALPNTTMVSIAHRKTVEKHHSRILELRFFNSGKEVTIEEKGNVQMATIYSV